jgi:hypothetical protein
MAHNALVIGTSREDLFYLSKLILIIRFITKEVLQYLWQQSFKSSVDTQKSKKEAFTHTHQKIYPHPTHTKKEINKKFSTRTLRITLAQD